MTRLLESVDVGRAFGGMVPEGERDARTQAIVEAWNLMGGEIQWNAIGLVDELLGFGDPESLTRGLVQIRDHFRAKNA